MGPQGREDVPRSVRIRRLQEELDDDWEVGRLGCTQQLLRRPQNLLHRGRLGGEAEVGDGLEYAGDQLGSIGQREEFIHEGHVVAVIGEGG